MILNNSKLSRLYLSFAISFSLFKGIHLRFIDYRFIAVKKAQSLFARTTKGLDS